MKSISDILSQGGLKSIWVVKSINGGLLCARLVLNGESGKAFMCDCLTIGGQKFALPRNGFEISLPGAVINYVGPIKLCDTFALEAAKDAIGYRIVGIALGRTVLAEPTLLPLISDPLLASFPTYEGSGGKSLLSWYGKKVLGGFSSLIEVMADERPYDNNIILQMEHEGYTRFRSHGVKCYAGPGDIGFYASCVPTNLVDHSPKTRFGLVNIGVVTVVELNGYVFTSGRHSDKMGKDFFELPGGKLLSGEDVYQAGQRRFYEDVALDIGDLTDHKVYLTTFVLDETRYCYYYFVVKLDTHNDKQLISGLNDRVKLSSPYLCSWRQTFSHEAFSFRVLSDARALNLL